jgi:hypothetical protein
MSTKKKTSAAIARLNVSNKLLRFAKMACKGTAGQRYCCHILKANAPELLPLFVQVYNGASDKPNDRCWWPGWTVCSHSKASDPRIMAFLLLRQAILSKAIPLNYKHPCKSVKK